MEKKQSKLLLLSVIALATILASTMPTLYGFSNTTQTPAVPEPSRDRPAPIWMANLTDTQKAAVEQKIEEMKTAGATPREIHGAIDEMLQQWGIQLPQPPSDRPAPPWMDNLTEQQRATLEQKIEEMREAGASPQEIHSTIDDMLQEWGIRVPQCLGDRPDPPWMGDLTEQQKETLKQRIEELKAAGANPQEVRSAIDEMLQQWGIQVPQHPTSAPP